MTCPTCGKGRACFKVVTETRRMGDRENRRKPAVAQDIVSQLRKAGHRPSTRTFTTWLATLSSNPQVKPRPDSAAWALAPLESPSPEHHPSLASIASSGLLVAAACPLQLDSRQLSGHVRVGAAPSRSRHGRCGLRHAKKARVA